MDKKHQEESTAHLLIEYVRKVKFDLRKVPKWHRQYLWTYYNQQRQASKKEPS